MQHNFNVGDYLCTVTTSTSQLVRPLTWSVISWNPPAPVLSYGQQTLYQHGKLDALQQIAAALHVFPLLIEPPLAVAGRRR